MAIRKTDNYVVDMIDFRHPLSDFLFHFGGNIGYSVRPSERQKGYASEMLRLILPVCREFGESKVLITCDKENEASQRTIVKNGGVLEKEIPDLGEGVYLRFDGTGIKNERNFENGCTDMTILPKELSVCILRKKSDNSIIFSRFEIIKYMMAKISPEQIKYYGASYKASPAFAEATDRIQEKVKKYYQDHKIEIDKYADCDYILEFIALKEFIDKWLVQ